MPACLLLGASDPSHGHLVQIHHVPAAEESCLLGSWVLMQSITMGCRLLHGLAFALRFQI